jgi:hypothetical protein
MEESLDGVSEVRRSTEPERAVGWRISKGAHAKGRTMTKRKPKMVMGVCGHMIDKERLDGGRPWCKLRDCEAKHARIVRTRTDWETGAT